MEVAHSRESCGVGACLRLVPLGQGRSGAVTSNGGRNGEAGRANSAGIVYNWALATWVLLLVRVWGDGRMFSASSPRSVDAANPSMISPPDRRRFGVGADAGSGTRVVALGRLGGEEDLGWSGPIRALLIAGGWRYEGNTP